MIAITPNMSKSEIVETFMSWLKQRNPGETEFHQAVYEVGINVLPFLLEPPAKQFQLSRFANTVDSVKTHKHDFPRAVAGPLAWRALPSFPCVARQPL